jgi:hypothetical protein
MSFNTERYVAQSADRRPQAEIDLRAKIETVKFERDIARKAILERHCNELDALEAHFNALFDRANGSAPR